MQKFITYPIPLGVILLFDACLFCKQHMEMKLQKSDNCLPVRKKKAFPKLMKGENSPKCFIMIKLP